MQNILVDAGPIIALFDRNDRHHERALKFIARADSVLLTNLPVLAEVMANLDFSVEAQASAISWVSQSCQIDTATADDFARIVEIISKYRDLPADFADASLVALAERLNSLEIATIDKDFLVYRTKDKRKFVNRFFAQ